MPVSEARLQEFMGKAVVDLGAAISVPLFILGEPQAGWLYVFLLVILWLRHESNIRRLLSGAEGRIGR